MLLNGANIHQIMAQLGQSPPPAQQMPGAMAQQMAMSPIQMGGQRRTPSPVPNKSREAMQNFQNFQLQAAAARQQAEAQQRQQQQAMMASAGQLAGNLGGGLPAGATAIDPSLMPWRGDVAGGQGGFSGELGASAGNVSSNAPPLPGGGIGGDMLPPEMQRRMGMLNGGDGLSGLLSQYMPWLTG